MAKISPMAVVDPKANLADDVEVGPFCIIGPEVSIGAGSRLIGHVVVIGKTRLGKGNVVHPNAVLGDVPQDLKYKGETTGLEIGDNNTIRESVTVHLGTAYGSKINGGGITRIGDGNLLMVNTHVGHDAQIGSRCVIANNVMIAGHVVIGNGVILNGAVGINAWVTLGDLAYVGGAARIHHDVPPFVKVSDQDKIRALNTVGLRRAGISEPDIEDLEGAVRALFLNREKPFAAVMAEYGSMDDINPPLKQLIEFLRRRDLGKHGRYLESLRRQ
jgi:UDP-N-acetylglucosamine acyltransferase